MGPDGAHQDVAPLPCGDDSPGEHSDMLQQQANTFVIVGNTCFAGNILVTAGGAAKHAADAGGCGRLFH